MLLKGAAGIIATHAIMLVFFRFPKLVLGEHQTLYERRRDMWLERTNFSEEQLLITSSAAVCDRHFILGNILFAGKSMQSFLWYCFSSRFVFHLLLYCYYK